MSKKILTTFVMTILILSTNVVCKAASEQEMALTNAKDWLTLIDDRRYVESWDIASNILKDTITLEKWERSLSAVRNPLGKLISRKMIKQNHHISLPGVPDGSYFVIQYATKFENKKSTIETITMAKEKDETWRPGGYFIK